MTIFELVKLALDELYEEGKDEYGAKLDGEIKKRMSYLTDSYQQLSQSTRQPVNYKDPATRFAYVYKYVAAHADYLVQVMEELRNTLGGNLFTSEHARISCVGGGPGSDIIAALKYLDEYAANEPVKRITCYLLDREQAWADTWTELGLSLQLKVAPNVNFQPLDVTKPDSWRSQRRFLRADLFTLSFFVSEVRSLDGSGAVSAFFQTLFADAASGARFIYIDNGHSDFDRYFDHQWNKAHLHCVLRKTGVRMLPRMTEDKSSLGDYLHKFGQMPKIQGTTTYRVLEKP
jgi:hypothetical protein